MHRSLLLCSDFTFQFTLNTQSQAVFQARVTLDRQSFHISALHHQKPSLAANRVWPYSLSG